MGPSLSNNLFFLKKTTWPQKQIVVKWSSQWRKGAPPLPLPDQNVLNFMKFFGKVRKIVWPPTANAGSAPGSKYYGCIHKSISLLMYGQRQIVIDVAVIVMDIHIGESKEGHKEPPPPPRHPNSFGFMQFSGNFWQNCVLALPLGELAPPPRGNPRSATELPLTFYL